MSTRSVFLWQFHHVHTRAGAQCELIATDYGVFMLRVVYDDRPGSFDTFPTQATAVTRAAALADSLQREGWQSTTAAGL